MRTNYFSFGESTPISSSRAGNKWRCMCMLIPESLLTLLPLFSGFYDGGRVAVFRLGQYVSLVKSAQFQGFCKRLIRLNIYAF